MRHWLHDQRLTAVVIALQGAGARHVLDAGCGDGDLLVRLAVLPQVKQITGIDPDAGALARARARLDAMPAVDAVVPVTLARASVTDPAALPAGCDAVALVEVIEHLPPDRLDALEAAVFGRLCPATVVLTTPNAEFNGLLGVPPHRFRHPDHRFEWPRARFRRWAEGVAQRQGYGVTTSDIAGAHPDLGGASQMAVFARP